MLQFFLSWPKNSDLTPKELSLKLVTLLGLVATSRSSELHLLDLKFLSKFATYYSFGINGVFKTSKKGRAPKPMDFYSHPEETKLCPFSVIDSYISMTEPWRGKNPRETKLFLSYVPPHKPIVKSTLAGWIKQTLGLTGGIDTSTFQAHSTRSAASSKALMKGLSMTDVLERGSWSHESTWQKFYHKDIETSSKRFQHALLKL